ncbi:hypothetical protein SAMN05428990_1350 [Pseudoxanthomonas sp. YR558]|nr:hypothetical protein SAMN05428990_1350 [Pseudoxanthomonas sp. YR558]
MLRCKAVSTQFTIRARGDAFLFGGAVIQRGAV